MDRALSKAHLRSPMAPHSESRVAVRMRHMAAWADVSTALSTHSPMLVRLQSCTRALVLHLHAVAARIWLVTKDKQKLALRASWGARTTPDGDEPHIPVASPALRSVIDLGIPYVTRDASQDPQLSHLDWPPGPAIAYAGYPLLAGAETIGVLGVFFRRRVGPATLETLRTSADRIARAVRNPQDEVTVHGREAFATEAQRLSVLLGAVRHAVDRSGAAREQDAAMRVLRDRYALLSRREREVMALVVAGRLNKQVGGQLGISEITVKAHRGHVMRKMQACSLPDLVKIAVLLQLFSLP